MKKFSFRRMKTDRGHPPSSKLILLQTNSLGSFWLRHSAGQHRQVIHESVSERTSRLYFLFFSGEPFFSVFHKPDQHQHHRYFG